MVASHSAHPRLHLRGVPDLWSGNRSEPSWRTGMDRDGWNRLYGTDRGVGGRDSHRSGAWQWREGECGVISRLRSRNLSRAEFGWIIVSAAMAVVLLLMSMM